MTFQEAVPIVSKFSRSISLVSSQKKQNPKDSFDFVLCIEAAASFEKPELFVEGVVHVLRRGGRLLLADALEKKTNIKLLDALEDNGFEVELSMDISRHVHAVGLCSVPKGMSYLHIVAKKE